MELRERDQALLSTLPADERAEFEKMVDGFVRRELVVVTPALLRRAADLFDEAGSRMPPIDGVCGLLIAAALRERAAALLM